MRKHVVTSLLVLLISVFVAADSYLNTQSGDLVLNPAGVVQVEENLNLSGNMITDIGSQNTYFDSFGGFIVPKDDISPFKCGENQEADVYYSSGNEFIMRTKNAGGTLTGRLRVQGMQDTALMTLDACNVKIDDGYLDMNNQVITNIGSEGTYFDSYGQLVIVGDTIAIKFQDGGGTDKAQIWWNNGSSIWRFKTTNAGGSMTDRLLIKGDSSSTKVGVGRTPSTNSLEVEGDASKTTSGDWLANSDIRLKKNTEDLTGALNKVMALRPITFEWLGEADLNLPEDYKGETNLSRLEAYVRKENIGIPADKIRSINLGSFPKGSQMGFIAQESKVILPQFVQEDENGFMMMTYGSFDPLVVRAIQELKHENDMLREELCKKDGTYNFC